MKVSEDSTYLKLDNANLDNIKISAHHDSKMLWRFFRMLIGAISQTSKKHIFYALL